MKKMSKKCSKVYYRDINQETCEELKKLEIHFRNAYTLKALEAQIAEKEANRIAEEARERLSEKLITLQDEKIIEEEIKRDNEISKKREEYKICLEEQMERKFFDKLSQEESERKEREVLIEVDRIIDEEYEMMKRNKRYILSQTLRRERLIFEEVREIKRTMEMEKEAIASEKIQKYNDEMIRREEEVRKLQKEQIKRRQMVIEKVAKLFVDDEKEKRERQLVISDLVAEEIKRELLIEEQEMEQKIREKKLKLAMDLKEQMMFSIESEERCRERDQIFVDNVMLKIMENERLEILTAEAKRRKQMIYKKELETLIEERKRIRDAAICELKKEWKEIELKEEIEKERIKEERQQIIKEHVKNVGKYLKKGVLSKEEEEEFLQT